MRIADGTVPAISPDGTRLAYATAPLQTGACVPNANELTKQYTLVIRTLSTGTQAVYPQLPAGQDTGLPAPISHLSWSPDGGTLAVSIASVQDNEGWNLILLNPATARDYLDRGRRLSPSRPVIPRAATGARACTCRTGTCSSAGPAAAGSRCTTSPG